MQQYKKNLNEKEMKIQEMWDNVERSNSQIISITEGEESQDNGIVKIFKKFQKDFFGDIIKLRKDISTKYKKPTEF